MTPRRRLRRMAYRSGDRMLRRQHAYLAHLRTPRSADDLRLVQQASELHSRLKAAVLLDETGAHELIPVTAGAAHV